LIGRWSTHQLAAAIGASVVGADAVFRGVTTDSRVTRENALFIALEGPNFNGHDFAGVALDRGAVAAMTRVPLSGAIRHTPQVIVDDTTTGLGQLAAQNRQRFSGPVVAITGSAGKTTVKELIASILGQAVRVCKTEGNFNNHIGVPLSLLKLQDADQAGVFELGASALHEIAYTVALVRPDVAVLNNAHEAHLEGFGSLHNIRLAKGEIVRDMPDYATAVLNADDDFFPQWLGMVAGRKMISFGFSDTAQVSARDITSYAGSTDFTLVSARGGIPVALPLLGNHNVANALAASAAALAMDLPLEQIKSGLEAVPVTPGRMVTKAGVADSTIIDDTYNANPAAMQAALSVLAQNPGRKIAVLGHMAELGEQATQAHEDIGRQAKQLGIDELWVTGPWADGYKQGFGQGTRMFGDKHLLKKELRNFAAAGDVILIKGSRSAGMEEVVAELVSRASV